MKRQRKNVTFQDIADYTHFSKTTISRYFNNPESLTIENQDKIAEALRVLDYKENKVARILANGKTEIIGLIVPNMYLHFYALIMDRILHTYEKYGYKFLIFPGDEDEATVRRYIDELLAYKIEGLLILSHSIPSEEIAAYNIPVVGIEREDQYIHSVNTDNDRGGELATELLYENQCDVLVHIDSPTKDKTPAYGRRRGFVRICQRYGIPYEIHERDFGITYESILQVLLPLEGEIAVRYPSARKGIFLSNDTFANLFETVLIRKYGHFPADYRLVGFDDSPAARSCVVPISTVGQQVGQIVDSAMELLVQQMEARKRRRYTPSDELIHRVVPPVLIPRETAPAPGSGVGAGQ